MTNKYWKNIMIAIVILTIVGGSYYIFNHQEKTSSSQKIDQRLIMEVKKGSIEKTIAAEGFIQPANERDLSFVPGIGSKIKKIYVAEGERVEKGQLLMAIDETEARLRYLQKKNQYNRAKINGLETEIEIARLDMELAENYLEDMQLRAPFSGTITDIYVEEGDYYSSGNVATLKDTDELKVEVRVEESTISDLEIGQKARISLQSLPGRTINGKVTGIEDELNNGGGTVTLSVTITLVQEEITQSKELDKAKLAELKKDYGKDLTKTDKTGYAQKDQDYYTQMKETYYAKDNYLPDSKDKLIVQKNKVTDDIKLGSSASIDIVVDEVQDKIVIPIVAVVSKDGYSFVTKIVDGKEQQISVRTGLSDGFNITIESGLEPGDQIILNTYKQITTTSKTDKDNLKQMYYKK